MIKVLKNKYLKKTISLITLVFLLSLVFAAPASAVKCENVLGDNNKNIRLQVNLPMKGIQTCTQDLFEMNDSGMFVKIPDGKTVYYVDTIQTYISGLYTLLIGVLSLGAIVVIMLGGFEYVWAAGNQQRISSAKSMISGALGGLALALLSYGLLNTINPQITSLQIKDVGEIMEITRAAVCEEVPGSEEPPGIFPKIFAEFPDNNTPVTEYPLTLPETRCGYPFYIEGGAGNSCMGRECQNSNDACVNGHCTEAIVYGTYGFRPDDRYINEDLALWYLCEDSGDILPWPAINVDLTKYKTPGDYAIGGDIGELTECDNPTTAKFFLRAEIYDSDFLSSNEIYYIAPAPSSLGGHCTRPLKLCAENDDNENQKLPDASTGVCPSDHPKEVLGPWDMDWNVLFGSTRLWDYQKINNKEDNINCNIYIDENYFPKDYES